MIELEGVSCRFGGFAAVQDFSLTIQAGEFCALIGPSGSGKSTTLRMINRLVERSAGAIRFLGRDIAEFAPEDLRRRMGYVIQSGGLFPHWTVERNIATVPELLGWTVARIQQRIAALMPLLRLDDDLRRRYPHQLSGGQQQRVGVARALAADPDVLLMDEPFAALDPITRDTLQGELAHIHRETGKTIVFVTHDMDEALRLAGRVAIMQGGQLVQVGSGADILTNPANDFVRAFVGRDEHGLMLLSVQTVASRLRPDQRADGPPIPPTASLRHALSEMVSHGRDRLAVADTDGRVLGAVLLADLVRR